MLLEFFLVVAICCVPFECQTNKKVDFKSLFEQTYAEQSEKNLYFFSVIGCTLFLDDEDDGNKYFEKFIDFVFCSSFFLLILKGCRFFFWYRIR